MKFFQEVGASGTYGLYGCSDGGNIYCFDTTARRFLTNLTPDMLCETRKYREVAVADAKKILSSAAEHWLHTKEDHHQHLSQQRDAELAKIFKEIVAARVVFYQIKDIPE
jgi:hypothetical protein